MLKGNYGSLRFVADYSAKNFKEIKKYNDKKNEESIKDKEKVLFGFITYSSAIWNIDQLCKLLNENEKFQVDIIIGHRPLDSKYTEKEFNETLQYFSELGYSTKRASDVDIRRYNIVFYLDPAPLLETNINLYCLPLNILVLHTSYSFMLAGNREKLNAWMYHMSYKYYTDSAFYKNEIDKHIYATGNTEFLGFPKMDQYYLAVCSKRTNKKVIIYAPHHSVDYTKFKSATFENNYMMMLEFAKKYQKDTYWIYKPHPRLRDSSVIAGIFPDVSAYDEYENQWSSLENADVVTAGDYFPVFKESDCMITDSVSFLAEYQFTHKPLLLLQSGMEEYNKFGESIVEILYKCDGKDKKKIEEFIMNCIDEKDKMYDERERFFEENLEYLINGETANKRIYKEILELIGK